MKFLSQLFEAPDTDWTSSAFVRARLKLVALYLLIVALVIALFAYLVVLQVADEVSSQKIPADSQIALNDSQAQAKAVALKPQMGIEDTEYLLEENTLLLVVGFIDGEDVQVDMLTGEATLVDDTNVGENFFELFTDDIDETIWWIGLIVFFLASFGSIGVATLTLQPIALSIKKQKQFVSDASHELRNPLAALQTTLESYIRSADKPRALSESVAEDLLGEVKRLIITSESLLQLETAENRTKQIVPCSVATSLAEVTTSLHTALEAKKIEVMSDISKQPLLIDTRDLNVVLYNLLHNALKFSVHDSNIWVKWDGGKLTVKDSGIGIASEHIPHIFERFYKADQARSFTDSGNGLGLALVDEIVSSYGGHVAVRSALGEGTTFTITW